MLYIKDENVRYKYFALNHIREATCGVVFDGLTAKDQAVKNCSIHFNDIVNDGLPK